MVEGYGSYVVIQTIQMNLSSISHSHSTHSSLICSNPLNNKSAIVLFSPFQTLGFVSTVSSLDSIPSIVLFIGYFSVFLCSLVPGGP